MRKLITLKLSDTEYQLLDDKLLHKIMYVSWYSSRVWVDIKVEKIDSLKEFLSSKWDFWGNNDTIKSIVSKLNTEVA